MALRWRDASFPPEGATQFVDLLVGHFDDVKMIEYKRGLWQVLQGRAPVASIANSISWSVAFSAFGSCSMARTPSSIGKSNRGTSNFRLFGNLFWPLL